MPGRKNQSQAMMLRARQQAVLSLYAQGQTPDQIALQMKMSLKVVNQDIAEATDRLVAHYTCPPQHTFIRYAVFNLGVIRKLQTAVERFEKDDETTQYNSVVSALRAQSDVYDKILAKGLEFGVVERKRASKAVRQPKDLQRLLKGEILTLSRLLDEVDISVQFHAARKQLALQTATASRPTNAQQQETYTPIIIKPLIGPYGVIKALPDWKYPKRIHKRKADAHSTSEVALKSATPEQLERLHTISEINKLSTALEESTRKRKPLPSLPAQEQPKQQPQAKPQQTPQARTPQVKPWLVSPSKPPSEQA